MLLHSMLYGVYAIYGFVLRSLFNMPSVKCEILRVATRRGFSSRSVTLVAG